MRNSILFLTLRIFSATGGIEKVCRLFGKSLFDLNKNADLVKVFSLYDQQDEADEKYIPQNNFAGFGQKKTSFVLSSVKQGIKSNIVIVSHINLLSIGFFIKLLSPKTKLVLLAHGIEVWGPLSFVRKFMLRKCDKILAVSSFTKENMEDSFKLQKERITILNNCLDPFLKEPGEHKKDELLLKSFGFGSSDIILLTLTRLSSREFYKGYDHILFSVKTLKDKYPNIKYLIVGKFDDEEKWRLDKIIENLGIKNNVFFTGFIPDGELAKHFMLADLYVMPSKKEGFGIVFIEALFYGLPVIAGSKDGSADALLNGKLGILVDPDDQEEINNAIEKVLLNRSAFKPDHSLLMQHFSFDVYKKKLGAILQNL